MTKINKEGWEIKKLGEVGTFLRCNGILKSDFVEHGKPCIHYGQIHTKFDTATYNHLSEISEELFEKSKKASKGDIVIAITSEDIEGSCKCTAWLGDYDIAVGAHAAIYKHTQSPKFIAYYFKSGRFYIGKSKYARGFKVMEIKPKDIAEIEIPLPPLPIQQRIVEELDEINAIISAKKQQLSKLDELAQSIFYTMFGDPVANDKGWEVKKYGEVFEIGSGGTPSKSKPEYWDKGNIPWIGSNMCQNCFIHKTDGKFITEEGLNHSSAKLLEPNTVLVALVGATIGKTALLKTTTSTNQNVAFIKTANNEAFTSEFVFFNLTSLYEEFMNIGNGDFKMANLSFVRNLPLIIPPLPLQETFATRVSAIEEEKAAIAASIEKMQTLLDARMQEYFG